MMRYVLLCAALLLSAPLSHAQPPSSLPERFTAFGVSTGGPRTTDVAARVDITINRWSTAEEAQQMMRVLKEKGAEALLETLREFKPVGSISTPGNVAYELRYAQQQPTEGGGRRIFLATDRPVTYWEAAAQPRVAEYPFTFIELRMTGKGEGEGKLALATKIDVSSDEKVIELVNYANQPIQLNQVRRVSK